MNIANFCSVISGKTGTGKSLLLAAIVGEADLLRGQIASPSSNTSASEIQPFYDGWIVPTAVAYVGQVPWIRNASVKDTVLYDFPVIDNVTHVYCRRAHLIRISPCFPTATSQKLGPPV